MLMWKLRVLYVFLGLIVIGVLKESILIQPRFKLDDVTAKLTELRGQIDLEFVGSDKYWKYCICDGKLVLRAVKDFPPAHLQTRPYIYFAKDVPSGLPTIGALKYYGPYCLNSDKSLMLLSLSTRDGYSPDNFALIRMSDKKLLFERKSSYRIEDIAWSSDSKMFAILGESSRMYFSATGVVSLLFGHPAMVYEYYLSVYDSTGRLVLATGIASGLVGGGGQVSWKEEEEEGVKP